MPARFSQMGIDVAKIRLELDANGVVILPSMSVDPATCGQLGLYVSELEKAALASGDQSDAITLALVKVVLLYTGTLLQSYDSVISIERVVDLPSKN